MKLLPHALFAFLFSLAPILAQNGDTPAKPAETPVEEKPTQEPEVAPDDSSKPAKPQKDDTNPKAGNIDFATQILPILEKNCVECHKAPYTDADGKKKRPKGGVILDSKDGMTKAKKGKLVVAKKPDDSLIVHSISLPADDEDRMPPAKKGDPLAQDDIDLIKTWIEQGADFGTWKGTGAKTDDKSSNDKAEKGKAEKDKDSKESKESADTSGEKPKDDDTGKKGGEDLALGLEALPEATLATFADRFTVEVVEVGSPLLRVTCYGREARIDDAAIAALVPLSAHVAELVLARTPVTDAAMTTIAAMPRLSHLDLRQTAITDAGCTKIASLAHLRSLNLHGTKVGDRGLAALSQCASLQSLYVWQTPVSAAAVVALQHALPTARVVFAADLPSPMTEEQNRGGRARR